MADLNALIAQGAQFAKPADPFAQYAQMQQLEQGQRTNALAQMKMDEYQRGIQEQNALRGLYGAGIDQSSPEFLTKLGAISPTAAQAHQKSTLEAKKTQAEIAKAQEDVRTSQNKALGQGLLIALKDPSDAGLDQAFGLLDAQKIDTKPFRAQFAQIADPAARKSLIQQYVTGTEEGRKALEFVQPKPEKIDLGGKVVTIDINPNSPTFKQQITEAAKTQSPDSAASVAASLANAAATREVAKATRESATAQRDQATEMKLADDYRAQSKDFQAVNAAYKQISSTLDKATTSPAATLAAATKFMKLLDPGSVVRESELGMALQASGVIDRATNYYNILAKGKVLTPTQVEDFRNITNQIYGAAQQVQKQIDADYTAKAKAYNLRPENVVQKMGQDETKPAAPPKVGQTQDGYRFKGGNPADPKSWEKL